MGKRRKRWVRFVFVVAILTTIATSAPQGFTREDAQLRTLAPLDTVHVRVVFSAAANEQAETTRIEFNWTGNAPVMLVPDDPASPPVELFSFHTVDPLMLCPEVGPCELGFTIDAGDIAMGDFDVFAQVERGGDPSFCFPENRDFIGDATVEVIFE